jgi:hypothetical protein
MSWHYLRQQAAAARVGVVRLLIKSNEGCFLLFMFQLHCHLSASLFSRSLPLKSVFREISIILVVYTASAYNY